MSEKQLSCTIKLPISLSVDTKTTFDSGCKIIDVIFPGIVNPEIGEIHFKNWYVAFITVKAKVKVSDKTLREGSRDHGWRMAIRRFKLMPDPHAETGAQDSFCLTKKHFQCEMNNVVSLRIILQQPSPLWKDFKLDELKLFRSFSGIPTPSLPACILQDVAEKSGKRELEVVPDLNKLSSGLQQLWALAEETAANQTQQSLGRYDVDGCYDINLLSYT